MSDIFTERKNLKPYEYPQCKSFTDAIQDSFWTIRERRNDVKADVQDYKVKLSDAERETIKRAMLAISQVEVSVKSYYGVVVAQKFPKPEIADMATTFAESEVRHQEAYSFLLELLGYNKEFENLLEVPALNDRIEYLGKYKQWQNSHKPEHFIKSLILFAIFIEGTSLMSQFLIIQSFKKHKNLLRGIAEVVSATSKEESLHFQGACLLINILRKEMPELFTPELEKLIMSQTKKALDAELKVLNWIFEEGDLEFLKKDDVVEFVKNRLNTCLGAIGYDKVFEIDETLQEKTEWFELSLVTGKHGDFFANRPTDYSRTVVEEEDDDLFD